MRPASCFIRVSAVVAALLAFPLTSARVAAQAGKPILTPELKVGDRVMLWVDGEKALTDSFTVAAGPSLDLPLVGVVSLVGVRQADLAPLLTTAIGRYVKNPVIRVQVRSEMRLGVLGEIVKPGYYDLPKESPIADVIMKAGGPTRDSKLKKMHIERSDSTLIEADSVRKALDAGATITQLGLQSGDRFVVPAGGGFVKALGVIGAILAVPLSIFYLTNIRR